MGPECLQIQSVSGEHSPWSALYLSLPGFTLAFKQGECPGKIWVPIQPSYITLYSVWLQLAVEEQVLQMLYRDAGRIQIGLI